MGKNHIVINSQFQPFSYDQLVRPLQESTQAHMQLETDMSELSAKASEIGNLANQEKDPEIYAQYKKYEADLLGQAEGLAKQGLNPTSRKNMLGMRTRFAEDIVPIQRAHSRIQELDKEQRQAELANPTMVWSKKASAMTLKEAIDNPMLGYESAQGNLAAKQVAEQVKGYADQILDPSKRNELRTILGGQRFEEVRQYGFTREALLEVMSGAGDESLNAIIDNAVAATGVTNWGGESEINQIRNHAKQGIWAAMGKTDIVGYDNKEYETAAQRRAAVPKDPTPTKPPGWFNAMGSISDIEANSEAQRVQGLIDRFSNPSEGESTGFKEWFLDPPHKRKARRHHIKQIEERLKKDNYTGWHRTKNQDIVKLEELNREESRSNEFMKSNTMQSIADMGIDINLPSDQILKQLEKKRHESVVEHVQFDIRPTENSLNDFRSSLQHLATTYSKGESNARLRGVRDQNNKSVSNEVFQTSLKEGISGASYNRNAGDPKVTITTKDGGMYTVDSSMMTGFKEAMQGDRMAYEQNLRQITNWVEHGRITKEQGLEAIAQLQSNVNFREYEKVSEYFLRGYNQGLPSTSSN